LFPAAEYDAAAKLRCSSSKQHAATERVNPQLQQQNQQQQSTLTIPVPFAAAPTA
jgi:hypothetical protein